MRLTSKFTGILLFYLATYSSTAQNALIPDIFQQKEPIASHSQFEEFNGLFIREIRIQRVELFKFYITDTLESRYNKVQGILKQIHFDTKDRLIKDNLLFDSGDAVNPHLISDTERILRSLPYIRDCRIFLKIIAEQQVDVLILIQDRFPWSLQNEVNSLDNFQSTFSQRNIFGTGNQVSATYVYNSESGNDHGYELDVKSRPISNSFISFRIFSADNHIRKGKAISISREFLSPGIKYGGGFLWEDLITRQRQGFADSLFYDRTSISQEKIDLWVARSFALNHRRNLNFSIRYLENDFDDRPSVSFNQNERFHDRSLFMGAVSFTQLKFLKTRDVYAFKITEDIPVGFDFQLKGGIDDGEFERRTYQSVSIGYSKFYPFGFINLNADWEQFTTSNSMEDLIVRVKANYFSPLLTLGRATNRWFVRIEYLQSKNLNVPLSFDLSNELRVRDLNAEFILGNQIISGGIESVYFLKRSIHGFVFAPYLYSDWGFLKDTRVNDIPKYLHMNIGTGIRIRNENLVFDTFNFRMSYFPTEPEGNSFGWNITFSTPFQFQSFRVQKPRTLSLD